MCYTILLLLQTRVKCITHFISACTIQSLAMALYASCVSKVSGVTPCELVCEAVENPQLIAVRKSVAEDGTPCTNPDSSTGICAAGKCIVRLTIFAISL